MKLSFSILLLIAVVQTQAAITPRAASNCVAGSYGNGNGDGYKGFCCSDSDDCFNSCIKGVCDGPAQPTPSAVCISGSKGLGQGNGYNGYCCDDSDDCIETCVKGACNGPTKTTTASATPTSSGKCLSGSKGLGEGDGYKGYCCDDSDDCVNTCVEGVCNGPTKTTTTTSAAEPTSTCAAGSKGLGNGDGYKGDCCKNSDDCVNSCVRGVCNGPSNPNPNPGKCISGYKGNDNGDGPLNACCASSDDCQEACVRGRCTKP